jgi:hypothetical protein
MSDVTNVDLEGFFWADEPAQQVRGHLTFTERTGELALESPLPHDELDTIRGTTLLGEPLCLRDCLVRQHTIGAVQYNQVWLIGRLLMGTHDPDPQVLAVAQAETHGATRRRSRRSHRRSDAARLHRPCQQHWHVQRPPLRDHVHEQRLSEPELALRHAHIVRLLLAARSPRWLAQGEATAQVERTVPVATHVGGLHTLA